MRDQRTDRHLAAHLLGITAIGSPYPIARNDLNDSEFAGPTFSPDGRILFAGIQTPGHVLAITGPWQPNPAQP